MPKKYLTEEARREARRESVRRYRAKDPEAKRQAGTEYARKYRALNRSRVNDNARRYRQDGRQVVASRARELGISLAKQLFLWSLQDGCCALCKQGLSFKSADLDHCHTTGRVRGFLCRHCNTGIGLLKDRPDVMRAAAIYVERGGV